MRFSMPPVQCTVHMYLAMKTPTRTQWKQFTLYKNARAQSMTPEEFRQHWDVTHAQLAELVGKSPSTVAHWFSSGAHKRVPTKDDERRLAEIHALWSQFENEPQHLRQAWEQHSRKKF